MSLEEEAKAIERKARYIIFWESYLSKKCGWENYVFFTDTLDLKDIEKAIGKDNRLYYNSSAKVYKIKKVKKPLFPEEEDTLRFSFSKADIRKAIKKAIREKKEYVEM